MDKIFFHNLRFYAYHGALDHEKRQGQYFELDVELSCELAAAGRSDQLGDSCDYGQIYQLLKTVVTQYRFALLEALGESICRQILQQFPLVSSVLLRLRKPRAPLELNPEEAADPDQSWQPGHFGPGGSVGIELQRWRAPTLESPREHDSAQ